MTGTRFKPYFEMKESGAEWLGQIPAHWESRRLKHLVALRNEKQEADSGSLYIGMENVESWTGKLVDTELEVEGDGSLFSSGDVLFGKLRPYLAKALLALEAGQCSSEFLVLEPIGLSGRFLRDLVLSQGFIGSVDSETYGTKMPRANWDTVGGMRIAMPSRDEQRAIADFLDRETAKLDALVEKKERLIELLQEKRSALITHAVTKGLPAAAAAQAGLDPNVPMKDSGIEWLGQIPVHWEIKPLKAAFVFRKGRNAQELTASYIKDHPGEFPVYSGQTENNGLMGLIDSYEYHFPEVILTTTVGARVMTPMVITGRFSLSQNCLVMIPEDRFAVPRFFFYQLFPCFDYERASIPDHMQPSLRVSDLMRYRMAAPPISERAEIADFLDRETAKIDALIAKVGEAIERLKEYRIALISAAVTGKIDVRGL